MGIGEKIKTARLQAGLTQEQVAEALKVSRQTVSNWENEKTYPDILRVIELSDLYTVSLDYLLKGNSPSCEYLNYLSDSTNTVKSKNRWTLALMMTVYMMIWATAVIVFWFFTNGSDAMGYSLVYLWVLLPVATISLSLWMGCSFAWNKYCWLFPLFLGTMYMLAEYATFSLANMIAFRRYNSPHWSMIFIGTFISLLGLLAGFLFQKLKRQHNI